MLPMAEPRTAEAQPSPAATGASTAADSGRPILRAVRITEPPTIDGRLSDEVWAQAAVADHFTQRDPDEGQAATERTEIRVLYDDDALYVGARLYDTEPARISRRVTARDEDPDADCVTIFLDPRHDHRTGVTFTVTAAGSQHDTVLSNDTFQDASWNAVWTSAVSYDGQGWSAELRIPFSQLRFNAGERHKIGRAHV